MPDDFLGNLLDAYLTPAQLASELGVSVRSIHRWHALRQGPPRTQIGRRPMYRRDAVKAWLGRHEKDPEPEMRQRKRRA